MALDRQIARLAKILVDSEGVSFDEAQSRLRALTLEIVVGPDALSPAAHAAVLTAVSVGRRTFVGGVQVTGTLDQPLNSALIIRQLGRGCGRGRRVILRRSTIAQDNRWYNRSAARRRPFDCRLVRRLAGGNG